MLITSSLSFEANTLVFNITSELYPDSLNSLAGIVFSSSSSLQVQGSDYSFGQSGIPALASLGGDSSLEGYGYASALLPSLLSVGSGGLYVPEDLQEGSSSLPSLFTTGLVTTSSPGSGEGYLTALISKGGDTNYGEAYADIPKLSSLGREGSTPNNAEIYSLGYVFSATTTTLETIIFINSTGQVVDSVQCTREAVQSILESLNATDSYSAMGEYLIALNSPLGISSAMLASLGNGPSIDSDTRVWVVNLESSSSAQYENYGYNSFFERESVYYGIADDGIYKLDGDDDNGIPIVSLIELGKSDFELSAVKSIPNVYIGVGSDSKMYLKVEADNKSYVYEARSNSEYLKTHRVDIGKGLKGNYYNFTLMNNSGGDFELESVSFNPIQLSRKI